MTPTQEFEGFLKGILQTLTENSFDMVRCLQFSFKINAFIGFIKERTQEEYNKFIADISATIYDFYSMEYIDKDTYKRLDRRLYSFDYNQICR